MVRELVVEAGAEDERIDVWVARALGLSRAQVKALAEGPGIRVNGRRAKRGDRVQPGSRVTVEWEEQDRAAVAETPLVPLNVLHVDEQLVVLDKPPHVPSHPLKPGETGTVANALVALYPE
jgi:23S rRNA pseudouridine1911/1915/1917 synthase